MVLLYMLPLATAPPVASPLAMPTCCAAILRSIGQQTARDDTIVGSDIVVAGGELNAIVHRAHHLVIVNAVEGRHFLCVVAGFGIRLDPAATVGILGGLIRIGALNVGVVDIKRLVGCST